MSDIDYGSLADYSTGGSGIAGEYRTYPELDIDYREVRQIPRLLKYIEKHGGDARKPLKRFNVYMLRQTDLTFKKGGRGPYKWPPLAPLTVIMRAYRARGKKRTDPRRILQDTGQLKNSTKTEVLSHGRSLAARIYNDVSYGKTHQEGGTMTVPAKTIRAKKAKALHFFTPWGHEVFAKSVYQPEHTVKIPARPFLFFLEQDKAKAIELFLDHAREITERGLREQRA